MSKNNFGLIGSSKENNISVLIEPSKAYIEKYLEESSLNTAANITKSETLSNSSTYINQIHKTKKRRHPKIRKIFKWSIRLSIGAFAIIGLVFTSVFVGMRFGIFNVQGSIAQRNSFYGNLKKITLENKATVVKELTVSSSKLNCSQTPSNCDWINSPQWTIVKYGLLKDASKINEAAAVTGVSPMMIVACVVPEQLRLFTSEREEFETYFQPLKILGSMTQFSLGVAGVKQQTADQIETYASDPNSPFYPGPGFSSLFAYPAGVSHSSLQFDRLTSNDHYYDYLYVGLFIKEIEAQWLRSGYDINQRPDIITTLYNIGFIHSVPKPDPEAGGSTITVNNQAYSFGELGTLVYNSGLLASTFSSKTP